MIKTTIGILALSAAIAMPALADDGVLPQQSKIIVNHEVAQQGVPAGHGATTGKRHTMHKGAHKGHHRMHHAAAAKKAAK